MKTFTITIAMVFAMLIAKAGHNSVFNLKMFDNGNFSVVLDEKFCGSQAGYFTDRRIKPGNHRLKVIRTYIDPYSYYPISKVVFRGWITIPARAVVYAQINCHSQFDVMKIDPFCPPAGGGYGNHDECDDEYGHSTNYGEGNDWQNHAPPLPAYIPQENFMQLKASMISKSFESSRFEIAKQALAYNFFTSAQIAELTSLFSFESTRLDFAKLAYLRTVDRQNYFLINNVFSFESSIGELNQYIAMVK